MSDSAQSMSERADLMFRFVMLYHDFAVEKKDYGTGKNSSMVEVHLLLRIAQNPGITVTELADFSHRTKSAISQTIKRLEADGYISRRYDPDDKRIVRLYPTDSGLELNAAHLHYDSVEVAETFETLRKHASQQDLDAFFRILDAYVEIFSEEE